MTEPTELLPSTRNGRLIAPHGTLGSDLGVARVMDNTANALSSPAAQQSG